MKWIAVVICAIIALILKDKHPDSEAWGWFVFLAILSALA